MGGFRSEPFNYPGDASRFNDPFILDSNLYIPKDFPTALEFCLYLAVKNPTFTQATRRTVSHFVTDFEFVGKAGDQAERNYFKDYLTSSIRFMDVLQQAGMEQLIYGNSFMYIYYPFNRYLVDNRNGKYREYAVDAFGRDIKFNLEKMTYNVPDPATMHLPPDQRSRIDLEFIDRRSFDPERIKARLIDPRRMLINMNLISGTCEYIYRFEEFFVAAVRNGDPIYQVNDTPMDMLKAIRENSNFAFNPGNIFHFRNPFISGLSYNGWGIPNILLNYNNIHHLQVLRCVNEAVGMDYMLPFRLLCPANTSSQNGNEAAMSTNLGRWQAAMTQLIHHKRKDPKALFTVPFPVQYQELGSNGKALAPVELINAQRDEMLDGMGYPAELWHMSLQTAQVPTAVRLFESTYVYLQRSLNNAVRWFARNVLGYLEKEQMGIKLMLPSMADDLEKRHVWMQLASGGEISRATAYRAFNIDNPLEEAKRRAQEDIAIQELKEKENQDFERKMTLGSGDQVVEAMLQAQGGDGGQGAPPPPQGGGGGGGPMPPESGMTPLDIEQQAEQTAMKFLQIQDVGERQKAMAQVRATNPTLYAVVKQKMEEMRAQGASEGRKSVGQQ